MKLILSSILLFAFINVFGQNTRDTIMIKKHSNIYMMGDQVLAFPELISVTSDNPDAYNEIWKAKSNQDVANVFGMIGGFFIGWPLGTAIGGGEPQWALAGVGLGLVAIAIPLEITAKKQTLKAIKIYNEGIKLDPEKEITLKAGIYNDGIGICLKF